MTVFVIYSEMPLKDVSSSGHYVQQSETTFAILEEGILEREIYVWADP